MNTRTVPVEIPVELIERLRYWADRYEAFWPRTNEEPNGITDTMRQAATALAAAPPQPEPLRCNLTGMRGCAYPVNAAPEQSERESITSPSQEGCAVGTAPAAAPITSSEAVSACLRCGKTGAVLDDGHTCITFGGLSEFAFCGTLTGTLTADGGFTTNNAAGQISPENHSQAVPECASESAPAAPERRQSDRRVAQTQSVAKYRRFWERRVTPGVYLPAPAAPTTMNLGERADSALPLSVETLNALLLYYESEALKGPHEFQDAMRNLVLAIKQALHAIELEQQVKTFCMDYRLKCDAETKRLERQVSERDAAIEKERARNRTLCNAAVFATERAEKAEAGLAELRKDAATIASMIQNVIVERRVKS